MLSVYVHIPFCARKCSYCAFPVAVSTGKKIELYLNGLLKEIKTQTLCQASSIYVGGGTPSLLSQMQLRVLFRVLCREFPPRRNAEVTMEINPENVDGEKAKLWLDLGVNRASLGIQTFQGKYLKFLGRGHDARTAVKSFEILRKAGFRNINADMMYGFPGQTMGELKKDLRAVVDLHSDHVSAYTLEIEKPSRLAWKSVKPAPESKQMEFYECVRCSLDNAGLHQYEISNFARPRKESFHNKNYWQGGNYLGFGMGAHSHRDGLRSWNVSRLDEYIRRARSGLSARESEEKLGAPERLGEALLFGLRMNEGVRLNALEKKNHAKIGPEKKNKIQFFIRQGLLENKRGNIRATDRGRLVLDEISAHLV